MGVSLSYGGWSPVWSDCKELVTGGGRAGHLLNPCDDELTTCSSLTSEAAGRGGGMSGLGVEGKGRGDLWWLIFSAGLYRGGRGGNLPLGVWGGEGGDRRLESPSLLYCTEGGTGTFLWAYRFPDWDPTSCWSSGNAWDVRLSKPPWQLSDSTIILPLPCLVLGGNGNSGERGGMRGKSLTLSLGLIDSLDSLGLGGKEGCWLTEDGEGEVGSLPPPFFWASRSASSSIESWDTFGRCCFRPGRVRNPPELWSGPFRSNFHFRG